MKYRKKPVVIEAAQWFKNGDHPLDYASERRYCGSNIPPDEAKSAGLDGEVVGRHRIHAQGERCPCCWLPMIDHGWVTTLEGGHIVCPGDWIITGVKGKHYPCKPDIFEATYEAVDES